MAKVLHTKNSVTYFSGIYLFDEVYAISLFIFNLDLIYVTTCTFLDKWPIIQKTDN